MIAARVLRAACGLLLSELAFAQNPHLQNALDLFKQERYAEALPEFESARAAQPSNPRIENALGITETKLGRAQEANLHYQAAIRLNPRFEEAHKNLGFNYLNANEFQKAEKELTSAIDLQPQDPYPHFYLAMLYLATARNDRLIEQVPPSLPLMSNDADIAFRIAKACAETNRADLALAIGEKSSLTAGQQRELAALLFGKNQYAQASELFRRVASAQPTWEDNYNLAIALLNDKKLDEAITLLEHLASERADNPDVLAVLGSAYESQNKMPEALAAYQKEAAIRPQEADRYLDYSRLLMDLARYDECVQFVSEGLQRVRDPYALYMRLGSVQMMASKNEQARTYFQKALDERPEIPVAYVAIAQLYFKNGQNEEAAKVLADARQKLKPDFLLEYYYGLALDRLGRQAEAVTALGNASSLNPDLADIHYELGRLYFETNRMEPARKELSRAIELKAHYSKAYLYLSRIYLRLGDSGKAHQLAEEARRLKQEEQEYGARSQDSRFRNLQPLRMP